MLSLATLLFLCYFALSQAGIAMSGIGGVAKAHPPPPLLDSSGALHHRLGALTEVRPAGPNLSGDENFALVLVNYKLQMPLLERLWSNATVRVCADGAINRLYRLFGDDEEARVKFIPEYIRGDLDSVEDDVRSYYAGKGSKIVQDHDQDTTDLQKCIHLLQKLDSNLRQVVVLGAFGGRIDHEFSHYHILYKYPSLNIVLISHKRVAFLLEEGGHVIHDTHMGPMCGLVPLGHPSRCVETQGLQWELSGQELSFTGLVSTSNKMVAQTVAVKTSHPILWVSELRDSGSLCDKK